MNKHRRLYFSFFIFICFLLALLSSQNSTIRWLDSQMFSLSSLLLPEQKQSLNFSVIQLDDSRLQSPDGIQEFRSVLRKLRKAHASEIVWLSNDFPQMDYVKEQTPELNNNAVNEEINWKPTEGERNKLAWMLEHQQIILTQYDSMPNKLNRIQYNQVLIYQSGWRQYIPALFLPAVKTFRLTTSEFP